MPHTALFCPSFATSSAAAYSGPSSAQRAASPFVTRKPAVRNGARTISSPETLIRSVLACDVPETLDVPYVGGYRPGSPPIRSHSAGDARTTLAGEPVASATWAD